MFALSRIGALERTISVESSNNRRLESFEQFDHHLWNVNLFRETRFTSSPYILLHIATTNIISVMEKILSRRQKRLAQCPSL